jgi:hypothetical protein
MLIKIFMRKGGGGGERERREESLFDIIEKE